MRILGYKTYKNIHMPKFAVFSPFSSIFLAEIWYLEILFSYMPNSQNQTSHILLYTYQNAVVSLLYHNHSFSHKVNYLKHKKRGSTIYETQHL